MEVCKIDNCFNHILARDMCGSHYRRLLKYGDPLGGGTPRGAGLKWINAHINYDSDDCLSWPFGKDGHGYGMVQYKGHGIIASRLMCIFAHGKPPTPKHEAAHSCGNGRYGCVNPKHLNWKTSKENHADKLIHGTHNRGERCGAAKLTWADINEIKNLDGHLPHRKIGEIFGVNRRTICDVLNEKTWIQTEVSP